MEPAIEVKDVSYIYTRGERILEDVNFAIFPGEITGIAGRSGSGKTTLCYLLKGIIPHSIRGKLRGTILVDEKNTQRTSLVNLSRTVGMVFQDINTQLFGNTVREEVQFGLKNLKMDLNLAESAMDELKILDIAGKSPHNLSMGQKQRVILASIIAMQPKILILDEPSVHLDTQNRLDLKNWLDKLNKTHNMTVLIASNDPWLIGNLCGDVLHIQNGNVKKKKKSEIMELDSTWNWKNQI